MEVAPPAKFMFSEGDPGLKKPSSSSSSAFLDSLVEKPVMQLVPNHLLESRVYMKLGNNVSVVADPGILHFGGFEIGKSLHRVLKLVNSSADVSSVHIIPPQTEHFTIRYRKAKTLAPGLAITVDVQFMADEWRYYSDCIRVHCKGEETLLVPLHAFPVMELPDFPSHVSLSDVALGRSAHHILPLRCTSPVDFEFCIACSQPHKDFDISPTSGIVPGGGLVEVTVTYSPSCYGTAQIRLELRISEFSAEPYVCVVTGTCSPRLTARKDPTEDVHVSPRRRPPGSQRPSYGVSRKKRHLQSLQQNASQVIEFQNLRFPVNLSNPHAVSTVLNQQPGRPRVRDLPEDLTGSDKTVKTRQEKEAQFQHVIQQNIAAEEVNRLRWQVHLGCDPISDQQRHVIMEHHQSATAEYQGMSSRPDLPSVHRRDAALVGCHRVLRHVDECLRTQPQFDLYLNDLWANRKRALRCFQQAGRRVLIRGRVDSRLRSIRKLLQRLQSERAESATCATCVSTDEDIAPLLPRCLLFYEFPPYPAEPVRSQPLQDLVSPHPRPAAALLQHPLTYQDLQVPQHFRLMAYRPVRSGGASSMYPSCHLARSLRRGAEDELMAGEQPDVPAPEEESAERRALRPPAALLSPPHFHPMHVFNPAPGLVSFKRMLSYSEIDLEYYLCPLPRYRTQQEGIVGAVRKEIIRGVMTWKKFPAVSLSSPLPASDSSKPRWCDPFSVELLPASAPPALSSLPPEDKDNVVPRDGDDSDSKVCLTPEMLRAEFTALQSGTPHDKLGSAERRVDSHIQGNTLADKVKENLEQMKLRSHRDRLTSDCEPAV